MGLGTAIIAAVQVLADALPATVKGLYIRSGYGTPGSFLLIEGETKATGRAWEAPSSMGTILTGVGNAVDAVLGQGVAMGVIATNATTVAPTKTSAFRLGTVTKNEGVSTLTVNFAPVYVGVPAVAAQLVAYGAAYSTDITALAAGAVTVAFWNGAGALIPINSLTVSFVVVGSAV